MFKLIFINWNFNLINLYNKCVTIYFVSMVNKYSNNHLMVRGCHDMRLQSVIVSKIVLQTFYRYNQRSTTCYYCFYLELTSFIIYYRLNSASYLFIEVFKFILITWHLNFIYQYYKCNNICSVNTK